MTDSSATDDVPLTRILISRLPPTCLPRFSFAAKPALAPAQRDYRLTIEFLTGHMVDAFTPRANVAFDVTTRTGQHGS